MDPCAGVVMQIWAAHQGGTQAYSEFFREVVEKTAELVAAWQCVGFCHGSVQRVVSLTSNAGTSLVYANDIDDVQV